MKLAPPHKDASQPTEKTSRSLLGRYTPRRVNDHTRWRFIRNRRDELIQRIGAVCPDQRQSLGISQLVGAEWALHRAEGEVEAAKNSRYRQNAMKIAADARKQVLLWSRELT